jgi:hypothetical protein
MSSRLVFGLLSGPAACMRVPVSNARVRAPSAMPSEFE